MTTVTLILPMPPSVNACFSNRRKGDKGPGRFVTPEYARWRKAASAAILASGKRHCFAGAVEIEIVASEDGANVRRDADNLCKPVLDMLSKQGVIQDDCRKIVRRCSVAWGDVAPGCIAVVITPVAYEAPAPKKQPKVARGKAWAMQQLKRRFGISVAPERVHLQ